MPRKQTEAVDPTAVRVLIVDDNKGYRDAFRRALAMRGYGVSEAENADDALRAIKANHPHVVITDLQMRTHTEGLDLIRQIKASFPLIAVIMISGVGAFEEGAEAMRLGSMTVIHKSRIEEEIVKLYEHIDRAYNAHRQDQSALDWIQSLRNGELQTVGSDEHGRLESILTSQDYNESVRVEAYDALQHVTEEENRRAAAETIRQMRDRGETETVLHQVEDQVARDLEGFNQLAPESREALLNAEFLYRQQSDLEGNIDLSRNIGFSYCFAVENEAKGRLRKRLQKFLSSKAPKNLIDKMLDPKRRNLNLFLHQALFHAQKDYTMEITMDNVRQVLLRIEEHGARYKPDGLKALGIVLMLFGRIYEFDQGNGVMIDVRNPLGLKGLNGDEDVMRLSELLISLQHFRNPFIHPEITDMAKISKIRETVFDCLRITGQLV